MSTKWPPIGTSYSSRAVAKIAMFQAALVGKQPLVMIHENACVTSMGCHLGQDCTFLIKLSGNTNTQWWVGHPTCFTHSHDMSSVSEKERAGYCEVVKALWKKTEDRERAAGGTSRLRKVENPEEDEGVAGGSKAYAEPPTKKRKGMNNPFPSYRSEQELIDSLVTLDRLPLPTPDEDVSFPNSYEALIQLHVASRQARFSLYQYSNSDHAFTAYCTRGILPNNAERCSYKIRCRREEGSQEWVAAVAHATHNHPIGENAPPVMPGFGAGAKAPHARREKGQSKVAATPPGLHFANASSREMRELIATTAQTYYEFPYVGTSIHYPSHEDFRLHAAAAAFQRNFKIAISVSGPLFFKFICSRPGGRFGPVACYWEMEVSKDLDDGEWRTSSITGRHNHPVLSDMQAREQLENEEKAQQQAEEEDRKPFSLAERSLGRLQTKGRASIGPSSAVPYPTPSPSSQSSLSFFPRSNSTPNLNATTLPFSSALSSFLYACSPSLAPHAPTLAVLGITSLDTLAALVHLSEDSLERLLQAKEAQTIPSVQRHLLQSALRRAKLEIY